VESLVDLGRREQQHLSRSQVRQSGLQIRRFHDPWPIEMRFVKIIASA
jgi:hypothetical protein